MVINIASFGGRTHMLDTARELEKFGHTVRFYSYVKDKRAVKFGLKKECNYSIFYFALPYLIWLKLFGFGGWGTYLYHCICDVFLAYYMKPCDVFIGQSPMHNYSIRRMKKKYHAVTVLERGTSHILEYLENLKGNPVCEKMVTTFINRDLNSYKYPDYICVGAEHVKESFLKHGFSSDALFVNNYGFDAAQFEPTQLENDAYDIIQVGQWGYRKGADLIIEACRRKKYGFLHVGSIVDIPFPSDISSMKHVDAVQQQELKDYYSKAKVFIMPSREEGLALVQMQAVACGLPLVCSTKSGGRDIRKYTISDDWIIEMKDLTVEDLIECIEKALEKAETQQGKRCYTNDCFGEASWIGYGKRYNDFLIHSAMR